MSERVMLEKLGDHNWPLWKYKVMLVLGEKGLADVIKADVPDVPSKDWLSRDGVAQSVIGLALEDSQLCHVMEKQNAKEMWDSLQKYHERKSMSGKVYLLRRLISLRLPDKGNMADHLSQITMLVNRLTGVGEKLADHWLVAIMLSSLLESYNVLVMSLESRADEDLTLDFVKGRLLEEWGRRSETGQNKLPQQEERALQTGKTKFKCHYCGKEGHYKRDCRKLKEDQQRKQNSNPGKQADRSRDAGSDRTQKVNKADSDGQVCFGMRASAAGDVWFLDSGCTSHMTGDLTNLEVVDSSHREQICLADGKTVLSEGIGNQRLEVDDGMGRSVDLKLKNVMHVPALMNNLLSVSKIADEGYEVVFDRNSCRIRKNGGDVVAGIRNGNLYQLKLYEERSLQVSLNHHDNCQHVWHRRLGHRHPEDISKIVREELGTDLKLVDCGIRSVCSTCCQGKLSCLPFPKQSQMKSKEVLDVIHTDLCGQMEVPTPSGNRYIMTMIDDCSCYCVVYLLQRKSQAEEKIEEFINLVRTQFGKVPKVIRSDGGGEYSSESLRSLLKRNGIIQQQTAPYCPQQNGKAERKNRSLIEMTRCLLSEADLDRKYWGEAVCTANYILNRVPASATGRTPHEIWFGVKPSYKHMKVFGSPAFVHVPKERRKKLDQKSVRMIFVGYAEGRKAYRFLNPDTDMVVISRDAKFVEELAGKEIVKDVRKQIEIGPSPVAKEDDSDSSGRDQEKDEDLTSVAEEEEFVSIEQSSEESDFEGFTEDEIRRRSQRLNKGKPPVRLIEEINTVSAQEEFEPSSFPEAMKCP